ncbi:hypothetical protein [Roseovarius sp. SYSU LYC5161]|uniref:hypothetical protein n=1 Tax=Roseovarius halophilus (ex Wu et al. 2025) TaxID=3376060 RepID=UPI00399B2A52
MKKSTVIACAAFTGLAACAAPPSSPEEKVARQAAVMRHSTTECTIYMGGVAGIQDVIKAANRKEAQARQLGATDALIAKAKQDVRMTWDTGVAMVGEQEMCSDAMSVIGNELVKEG